MEAIQNLRVPPFPAGVTVAVYNSAGFNLGTKTGTLSSIFDASGNALANPYATTAYSEFFHRAASGIYHLRIGGSGSAADNAYNGGAGAWMLFVTHFDPADIPAAAGAATTEAAGVVELATQAEANALTDAARVMTPAVLPGAVSAVGLRSGYVTKTSGGDLDATHVGKTVRVAIDSASTVAMPPTASLSAGQKIEVVNHGSDYLQLTGSNMLVPPDSGVTSGVILEIGDSATFTFTGSAWALTGGSVLHRYSAAFHSVHGGTSGYQILPAGFGLPDARTIIQWGFVTIGEFSDFYDATINFPVQFTASCDNIQITNKRTASTVNWDTFTEVVDFANNDLASFTYKVHDANADSDKTGYGFFWLAIGR